MAERSGLSKNIAYYRSIITNNNGDMVIIIIIIELSICIFSNNKKYCNLKLFKNFEHNHIL